jgi:hypothetical protein
MFPSAISDQLSAISSQQPAFSFPVLAESWLLKAEG